MMSGFLGDKSKEIVHHLANMKPECDIYLIEMKDREYFMPDTLDNAKSKILSNVNFALAKPNPNSILSNVFSKIENKGFSRIPIFEEKSDNIVGVLHILDIFRIPEKKYSKTEIGKISRKPFFVYSKERVSNLLIELKKKDMHMAIVIDDQDSLVGIITVEDLLEEIVGDIVGEAKKR